AWASCSSVSAFRGVLGEVAGRSPAQDLGHADVRLFGGPAQCVVRLLRDVGVHGHVVLLRGPASGTWNLRMFCHILTVPYSRVTVHPSKEAYGVCPPAPTSGGVVSTDPRLTSANVWTINEKGTQIVRTPGGDEKGTQIVSTSQVRARRGTMYLPFTWVPRIGVPAVN